MRDIDQVMSKLRLRRLLEELLDGDLIHLDIEEEEEVAGSQNARPVKRVHLVARYTPA